MRGLASSCRITIANAPAGALGVLLVSLANQTSYGTHQLPLALDPFGWIGCTMYVAPVATASTFLGTTGLAAGYAGFDLPMTLAPTGPSTGLAAQWFVFDPASLGFAATARHEFRVR